jgi:hypothetical protein
MKTQNLNTENVKNEIYYLGTSAYLDSDSFVSSENDPFENDDVYNEAIKIADVLLTGYDLIEVESHGKGSRAIWHEITKG